MPSATLPISVVNLEETHTQAEQRVYEEMYKGTIAHRRKQKYFTIPTLSEMTGLRSPTTIRNALQGLIAKQSIEPLTQNVGDRRGIRYRVYGPVEILARRRKAKIKIDYDTKEIIRD
ncbi:MAG: hypothetical protein AB1489_30910 [Acidobacteriota bacterium]